MLESCFVWTGLTALVSTTLFTFYLWTAKIWVHHISQETVLCLNSTGDRNNCKRNAINLIGSVLPFGKVQRFTVFCNSRVASVDLIFEINGFKVSYYQTESLPIRSSKL